MVAETFGKVMAVAECLRVDAEHTVVCGIAEKQTADPRDYLVEVEQVEQAQKTRRRD